MLDDLFPTEFEAPADLIEFIRRSKDRTSPDDYSSRSSLNSMFEGPDGATNLKFLPTVEEFERVSSKFPLKLFFDIFLCY